MGIFTNNTMAKFRNQLAQPLQLDGDWQVALASISFPSNINNVNSAEIVAYVSSGAELDASHNRTGQLRRIRKGIYNSSEELLEEIFRIAQLKDYDFDTVTQKLVLKFGPNEGLSFEDEEVPSILGFNGTKDTSHHGFIDIGYKSKNAGNSLNRHVGDLPVDITCGSQLIFVYIDIIEHQNVGDVRAPVTKIIESERRLRNGSINTVTPIHHKSYTNLDYKPILSNNIQNIQVELRNETGKLIPFTGTEKVIVSLKFQKIFDMEAYYSNQASQSMPHFSGHYRQRGSGFGALAAGIGRVALPLARKFLWPAAKKIGRDLLVQGAPELVEVATKRKSAKQALKSTVAKTARKQIGGSLQSRIASGRKIIRRKRRQYTRPRSNQKQKISTRRIISRKPRPKRSRLDFFSRVKNAN